MQLLLHAATLIAPGSPLHRQQVSLLIENGRIAALKPAGTLEVGAAVARRDLDGAYLSIGWCDMRALIPDPGFEHKESLQSGRKAAARGGFTAVALLPNTQPCLDSKERLAYILSQNHQEAVQLYPIGALSLQCKGEHLSDMIDLHHAGAVAFSDGLQPVWHSDLMLKSLLYLQHFGGLLINRPADPLLNRFGLMHEGPQASFLGLKGMPALAETMMLKRDLDFLEYCGTGKLHFSCLSSAASVALVRQAKAKGWEVSCDVAAHQLAFNDSALQDFDTHFKLNPPLRSEEDRLALWEGLADGTIDAVVSDHCPQDIESKRLEFDLAEFGAIGLETVFSAMNTYNHQGLSLEQILDKIAFAPRRLLGLPLPEIKEGAPANLTIFDTDSLFLYDKARIVSASHNSPFLDKALRGKVRGIVNGIYTEFFD